MIELVKAVYLAVFVNSLIPHVTIGSDEVVSYASEHDWGIWVPFLAAFAQVCGKIFLFVGARLGKHLQLFILSRHRIGRTSLERSRRRGEKMRDWAHRHHVEKWVLPLLICSAIFGLPSFGFMALIAGWTKMPWHTFLAVAYFGRTARYLFVYLFLPIF